MVSAKKVVISIVVACILLFMIFFNTLITFVTDYQWFQEVGYEKVFLTKLFTQFKIGIPIFIILTILIYFYFLSIKKDYYKKVSTVYVGLEEKRVNQIAFAGAMVVSLVATIMFVGDLWFEWLKFSKATSFGQQDPIFNNDISFYIFKLPLIGQIYCLLIGFVIMLFFVTFLFYFMMMSIRRPTLFDANHPERKFHIYGGFDRENIKNLFQIALGQLTILGFAALIILGIGCSLRVYNFLFSSRGVVYGASFTDVHVTLWVYRILAVLSFVSAVLFVIGVRKRKWKMAFIGPIVIIAVVVLGNGIALGVQNFIVAPDEINKERKYLEHDITYTRMAYGLDKIEEKIFPVAQDLDKEDLEKNRETIENIRINDYEPAKQFYNQRHGMRLYYHFYDVDVDRYYIDGKYTQVFLSARELDYAKINQQWINQHLKYTHGYGVALSPVNDVTAEGQPNLLIKDIPPRSSIENLEIKRPEIYFGEMTDNYVITNTKEKEFDYPSGDENVETIYQGNGGISLKGINRILYAIKEKSLKILISSNVTSESRILLNRNIHDRVRKIAPFIEYDQDPYLIIHDGKLYWMIDGYTVSNYYPYAKPFAEMGENYIRNSVKVVIDAYNGDTTYYLFDEDDPIIQTLNKIFPQLFTPAEKMPEGIRAHVRYPEKLFNIQAEIYGNYHMSDIEVFYQGEDLWDISKQIYEQEQIVMEPSYFIMKLPGEQKEEFILSLPYTPKNKHNMTALFVARNDGESYGKLIIYKFPKEKTVYGPMQIEAKIDQDTDISKEFSLWGQRGSTYLRGNLLTIPIENSLLYIEPIYLKAESENSLPEVKRVVVAYQDRLAYENTLEEALAKMFGTEIKEPEKQEEQRPLAEETEESLPDLIQKANEVFTRAQEAQRNGDWAGYGRYIDELSKLLQKMQQQ